jgi:hypothetical protein
MISKEKTINKALSRYKEIYPMKNKKSFDECFFYLHGEVLFVFRTKNKKIRTIKAVKTTPAIQIQNSYLLFFISIYKVLTKPISIGTLIGPAFARQSSAVQGRPS